MTEQAHPSDAILADLAEGYRFRSDAHPEAEAHLASCSACSARLEAYRSVARTLAAASPLQRRMCPSPQDLLSTDLSADRLTARDAHVEVCPACQEDLADFRALEAPAPAETALSAMRARIVLGLGRARRALQVLESSLPTFAAPALAPARGESPSEPDGVRIRIPFGEGELEVALGAARSATDLRASAQGAAPRSYRLALAPAEEGSGVLESRSSDEAGIVTLTGLEPGEYRLTAYAPQRSTPAVEVELAISAA